MIRRRTTPLPSFSSRFTTRHTTTLPRVHAGNAANPFHSCGYFITCGHPGGGVTPAHRSTVPKPGCPTELRSLNSSLSYSSALFCIAQIAISHPFNAFRALCPKHPGWGSHPSNQVSPFRNLTNRHSPPSTNSRGMNSFKTDTKQTTLSTFRMSRYGKTRGGPPSLLLATPGARTLSERQRWYPSEDRQELASQDLNTQTDLWRNEGERQLYFRARPSAHRASCIQRIHAEDLPGRAAWSCPALPSGHRKVSIDAYLSGELPGKN